VSLVVGAGGEIGKALTARLHARGDVVLAADLPGRVPQEGERLRPLPLDLRDDAQTAEVLRAAGPLDRLCYAAGVSGPVGTPAELTLAAFDTVMDLNLRAALGTVLAALPGLRKGRDPAVATVASIGGLRANGHLLPYTVSKHALLGLTKALAKEFRSTGVRVNAVCPGPVESSMLAGIDIGIRPAAPGEVRANRLAGVPMGRYATTDEVAAAAEWLLGPDSGYCNGTILTLDGGITA
jgi:NAD(P)-dependent dehydrogenase (short-subunit alcohol dehydrogenase family)